MLRGGDKTPDGFTRKNPPVTPDGYYRRKDGLVEPDQRTPKGFVRNPKPDEAGTSKSYENQQRDQSREARYDTKKVLNQVVEKLDNLNIAKDNERDYGRDRSRRDSRDGRSYYRNDRRDYRDRRDSYDRNRSRGYSRDNYGRDRRPSSVNSNGSWGSRSPSRGRNDSRYDRSQYDRYRGRSGEGQRRKEERYYHRDNSQKGSDPRFEFTRKWVAYNKDGKIDRIRSRSQSRVPNDRNQQTSSGTQAMACTTNLNYHYTISLPRHAEHFGDEHELPVVKMKVGKANGKGLLDTGASRTMISERIAKLSGGQIKRTDGYVASGINGLLSLDHEIETYFEVMGHLIGPIKVIVAVNAPTFANAKFDALVGKDIMKQLPALAFDLSAGIVSVLKPTVSQGAHMMNADLNRETLEVSRIQEMARAFESKGKTIRENNNSVKAEKGRELHEDWKGDFVFYMRDLQEEDSDPESEDMFRFV